MARPVDPQSRERILEAAEKLFIKRGYHAVSMTDIANVLGIKKPSLYHHISEGKEGLYVEITERNLKFHEEGLIRTLNESDANLEAQLKAAANWLLSNAPLGFLPMMQNGMPALKEKNVKYLEEVFWKSLFLPLYSCFQQAQAKGELKDINIDAVIGSFLSMVEGLSTLVQNQTELRPLEDMTNDLIQMMLYGIIKQ